MRRVDQELFNAAEQGNLSEIEKCLNRGANVLARDSHHTVLHSAVRSDNGEVVKLVLNKIKETQGPYIDAKDTEGDTPLMWTAETGYVNAAQVLLEYGANVEVKNNNGMTALHWAAKKNHIGVLKLLIDKRANVNVQDNHGQTPSDCARKEGHGEIVGYLVFSAAEVFREQGKYNKAWQTYQEAFDIQEVVLGPNHLDTLRTRHNMARVLSDQGKYSEALNIYQKVFDIQKFALRPDHPDTSMTRHNMAVVLREQGNYSEALNIYQEMFNIQKRKGADHPDTLMTRYNMAVVLSDQGKYSEALRILRKVLNIQEAKLGSDHPITLLTSGSIEIIQREKISGDSFIHAKTKDGHRETVDILDSITTEVAGSESSSVCSSLEDHQEVQESDEEYFESERDELEATKKEIIEYIKCRCDYVLIFRGKDRGKGAWHYVLIDPGKKETFLEQSKTGSVNAANYGRVLYSGWGENPPQDIRDKIDEFFNKKIPNDLFVIKEEHEDKNVYHYVLVDPDKKEVLQEQSKMGSAFIREIEDYGRILYSGWGQDPPESISDRIERTYFCTNERDLKEEFANLSVKDDNALHDAARNGELEKVRYLIRKGANVNSADKNGWTSLHHAAYVGNLEVVKYLMDSWANLHVKDTVCGRKPVHIAAREGHIDVIELFLNRGVKVSDADENSWAPLHYAAWNGHLRTVKLLINEGADIHAKDATRGKKPIHIAAEKGHTSIIELLVSSGISIDDADKEGRTPLYYAAWNGHSEAVKFLADKRANIHAENTYGTKPIHVATMEGHQRVIEFLLSNGVDVDDTNKNGWTPLHCAAGSGNLEIVKFLIERGANINARNNDGKIPLDIARANGQIEIIDILDGRNTERKSPTYTSLHDAAKDGDLEAVKYLIRRSAGVNDPNEDGWTPLHCAASAGELEVAEFLISKGANTHAEDNTTAGKKPIHVAAIEGHIDVIEFFLNKGISVDETDKEGRTSLYYAASNGHLETVKFLADKGANIHAKNIRSTKPIHVAALDGHKNIIEFLLDRGANVNDSDKDNWTPLHYAAQEGQLGVVRFLISKRANVHAKNTYGAKPIHIAAMGGSQEIIEFLLSNGASVDDTNKNGETPLHYAASEGRLEIVKFLIDKGANINAENIYGSKAINLARRKGHSSIEKLLSLHESYPIQSTNFNKEQQEKFLRSISDADVRRVKQGLYLPSFEARNVEIDGKCVAITRGLSQALFLQSNKSFLSNLETSTEIYERIAQGKQVSKREEREVFTFSKLLNTFERQLDSSTNSLPSNLIHTKGYKTLGDLSNYIAEIEGNFAIHLVTSNHVVAIYRTGDNYAYFDSNVAFASGLKSVDQLMEVVEKAVEFAGYEVGEKGFLVEHFDVDKANNLLFDEDKQILAKEIKTERQLLAEQDKELGFIKINGQELSRVQLYDFGTKINVEGSVPLLINADMNLSSKKFQDHLDKKEVSMTAREYLDSLKNSKNAEEATKFIPFIGSKREIEEVEQIRKPKQPLLEQLVKGAVNFIASNLTTAFFASVSRSESQLPGKTDDKPRTCLNDPTVDKQLQRSL